MNLIQSIFNAYHEAMARHYYRRDQKVMCLKHLNPLMNENSFYYQSPKLSAYWALCHYELKYWETICSDVERALFLLRRHIKTDKECFILWEDLKSHLTRLRAAEKHYDSLSHANSRP